MPDPDMDEAEKIAETVADMLTIEAEKLKKRMDRDDKMQDRIDVLEEALHRVKQWAEAYPIDIFPEPDKKKAMDVLTAAGVSIGALHASWARRITEGMGKVATDALVVGADSNVSSERAVVPDSDETSERVASPNSIENGERAPHSDSDEREERADSPDRDVNQ